MRYPKLLKRSSGKFKSRIGFWKNLTLVEKVSTFFLFLLFLTLPLTVLGVLNPKGFRQSQALSDLTPSPTPIATVGATPLPEPNNTPYIWNRRLMMGVVGRSYWGIVAASDRDGDYMEMMIGNLPDELSQDKCYFDINKGTSVVSCPVVGQPTKSGFYRPWVIVKDEHGATTTRRVWLIIRP